MQSSGQRGAFRRGPTRPGSAAHGASPLTHRPESTFLPSYMAHWYWISLSNSPMFQYFLAGPAGLRCRRQRNLALRRRPNSRLVRDSRTLTCSPPSCNVQDPGQICALRTDPAAWPGHYYSLASHYLPPKPCSCGFFWPHRRSRCALAPPTPGMKVVLQETAAPAAAADASVGPLRVRRDVGPTG